MKAARFAQRVAYALLMVGSALSPSSQDDVRIRWAERSWSRPPGW